MSLQNLRDRLPDYARDIKLNLGSLASIAFEFSVNTPGKLGFDDIEFSR